MAMAVVTHLMLLQILLSFHAVAFLSIYLQIKKRYNLHKIQAYYPSANTLYHVEWITCGFFLAGVFFKHSITTDNTFLFIPL
jgi:hypothetical protein